MILPRRAPDVVSRPVPGAGEVLDDRAKQSRRHLQVEQRAVMPADVCGQLVVQCVLGDVSVQLGQPGGQTVDDRIVECLSGTADRLPCPGQQLLDRQLVVGDADDRAVKQPPPFQPI